MLVKECFYLLTLKSYTIVLQLYVTALMLNIVMENKQQEHNDISPVELQSGCLALLCQYRQLFFKTAVANLEQATS